MRPSFRPMSDSLTSMDQTLLPHSPTTTSLTNLATFDTMREVYSSNKMLKPCLTSLTGTHKYSKRHKLHPASYKSPVMHRKLKLLIQCPKRDKTKCCPNQFNWTKVTQCLINPYLIYQCHSLRHRFKGRTFLLHSCHMKILSHGRPLRRSLQS